MAEAKNSFLKAKMNQDLDDRLLPNGEYRTAQNILVGKSEEDSVGTLENIKGNKLIAATDLGDFLPYGPAFIIGFLMDETNDRIYTFLTNWTESGDAPSDAHCSIRVLEVSNGMQYTTLVEGSFLNFSTRNNIVGVNLIEDLLFWTDNRNQPRKINVETARNNSTYYTKENHISVAKYNPYLPIQLYKEEIEKVISVSTNTITVNSNLGITAGMTVLTISAADPTTGINANSYLLVQSVDNTSPTETVVTLSEDVSTTMAANDTAYFLASTMTDKSNITTWPGDPNYLEDKFVRFAYRFKFDDNEYSIFSPFTQIAFIPKQKGYFINGDQKKAFSSSVVDFFENGINDIELIIPLPDTANNIENSYKIKEIEILYKESDKLAVRVLDTIQTPIDSSDGYYIYSYQSRKPKTTLAQDQTTRVYDKVPVRAFAQSVAGNRVIYGNFQTKHTPPNSIGYNVSVQQKGGTTGATNFIEHPNHTLKQNRNYQVGFVLSDKFGRQSDVILSAPTQSVIDTGGIIFSGSTIYSEYIEDEPPGSEIPDNKYIDSSKADWRGNALFVAVDSPIQSTKNLTTGAPGLYANIVGGGFDLLFGQVPTINGNTYTFVVDSSGLTDVPSEGEYLRGEYTDYVEITSVTGSGTIADPYVITTDGQANSSYLKDPLLPIDSPDTKFGFTINPLGWYSYKIVVKQVEQEYYNVYLPSAVAGGVIYPDSTDTNASTTYLSLINDNINKIPRDLSEVGPDQRQYRSSVKLFGRVSPTVDPSSGDPATYVFGNEQFYPNKRSDTSTNIGQLETVLSATALSPENFMFQAETDPIVVRVSTEKQFGLDAGVFSTQQTRFQLAVYETDPFVSAIDIFWETASAGLISDLNADVLVGFEGPVGFEPIQWDFPESKEIGDDITTDFAPINAQGQSIATTTLNPVNGFTVTSGRGDVTSDFNISQNSSGEYKISLVNPYTFKVDSDEKDEFTFELNIVDLLPNSLWEQTTLSFTEKLTNVAPSYVFPDPASPYYFFDNTYTAGQTIHDFGDWNNNERNNGDYSSNDGPGTIPNNTGLVWEITAGNDDGYFAINANTGVLTLTSAGLSAGIGTYCLDLKLTDASDGVGKLSVTKSPCIVKGYPPINNGGSYGGNSNFWQPGGGCPGLTQDGRNGGRWVYYLADSTIPNGSLPETADNWGGSGTSSDPPLRIGDALDQGQMLVNFNANLDVVQTQCDGNEYNVSADQSVKFRIYYRSSSSSSWNLVNDLNNYSSELTYYPSYIYSVSTGYNPVKEINTYVAYGNSGEYCFVVEHGTVIDTDGNSPYLVFLFGHSVNIVDLHNPNTPTRISIDTSGSSTAICKSTDTTPFVYSSAKLPDYAEVLFTDSDLLTVFQPATGNQYFPLRINRINGVNADDKTFEYGGPPPNPVLGGHEITVNPILDSNGSKLTTASNAYAVIKFDHSVTGCMTQATQPPNRNLFIT